ncbi:MAG: nuclear transport factor 2 family protein [Gemmatimonadota bacterium]|nr:nuclear transport factor 2 family protein [Gemmatimonadota bacterium]
MIGSTSSGPLARYMEAINRHDTRAALACLSRDFVLEFPGGAKLDRGGMESALGWDAGTKGRVEWSVVAERGNVITIEGEETNEFLRLLEIGPLPFESRFELDDHGLIAKQMHRTDWGGVSVEEALSPVLAWARQAAPAELAEVYPDGRMTYTEEAGRAWVDLLRRWSRSQSGSG